MAVKGLPDSCCLHLLITHNCLPKHQPLSVLKYLSMPSTFPPPLKFLPFTLFFPSGALNQTLRIQSWSSPKHHDKLEGNFDDCTENT